MINGSLWDAFERTKSLMDGKSSMCDVVPVIYCHVSFIAVLRLSVRYTSAVVIAAAGAAAVFPWCECPPVTMVYAAPPGLMTSVGQPNEQDTGWLTVTRNVKELPADFSLPEA